MAKIYFGRENIDFSKFIFDNIGSESIVLVPEQYSFQVEKDAFKYLNKRAVLDLEIFGFSRLGNRILEDNPINLEKIGKEGRQMVLMRVLLELETQLEVFGNLTKNDDFINLLSDIITFMKSNNVNMEKRFDAVNIFSENELTRKKVDELFKIYEKYNEIIKEQYMDNEDYIDKYNLGIKDADFLRGKEIWILGFDAFDEKRLETILELNRVCDNLNIVLTSSLDGRYKDLFSINDKNIKTFQELLAVSSENIIDLNENKKNYKESYKIVKVDDDISHIEKNLFSNVIVEKKELNKEKDSINLSVASNPYFEAVSVASEIARLVGSQNYRYQDIAIVSNNVEEYSELYKRVFRDFGIELFLDLPRNLHNHPVINLLQSILDCLKNDFQPNDISQFLKSEILEIDRELVDNFEIYVDNYFIRGKKWIKDFDKGSKNYSEEDIERFNILRKTWVLPLMDLRGELELRDKVLSKIKAFYEYLTQALNLPSKVQLWIDKISRENNEFALESTQVWNKVIDVLSQMNTLLGKEILEKERFIEILSKGIGAITVGIIPPDTDALIMGNSRRLKKGITKITFFMSVNEGILPNKSIASHILTDEELDVLSRNNIYIAKGRQVSNRQEDLEIYRHISRTTDKLYFSYCTSDNKGNSLEPSSLIQSIKNLFTNLVEIKDAVTDSDISRLILGDNISKSYLLEEITKLAEGKPNVDMKKLLKLYVYVAHREKSRGNKDLRGDDIDSLILNIISSHNVKPLGSELATHLYSRGETLSENIKVSPSRLENFGKCPYAHFMRYGIRPDIKREYVVASNDMGNIYHYVLKEFLVDEAKIQISQDAEYDEEAKNIHKERINKISGKNLRHIDKLDDNYIKEKLNAILDKLYVEYKDGIFDEATLELEEEKGEASYRRNRISDICFETVKSLKSQIASELIDEIFLEVPFGRGKVFSEISIPVISNSNKGVSIEGQIDRVDVFTNKFTRVIDYKSGKDEYRKSEAIAGIKLQLFIYLIATMNSENKNYEMGGSFYYKINDKLSLSDKEKTNLFKLEGIGRKEILDENSIYKKSNKKGIDGNILDREDFESLISQVDNVIKDMATTLYEGEIKIEPAKTENMDSCSYCDFHNICGFDLGKNGMKNRNIK